MAQILQAFLDPHKISQHLDGIVDVEDDDATWQIYELTTRHRAAMDGSHLARMSGNGRPNKEAFTPSPTTGDVTQRTPSPDQHRGPVRTWITPALVTSSIAKTRRGRYSRCDMREVKRTTGAADLRL